VDEDYYLPVRGSESGTKIDTLAGGANATAIEDVEYIQKKLFAALKIPKAYLGYDEGLGAKATLSQEDIRFSRTVNRIQRTVIAELNKLAIIHLFSNGFEGEDLLDFTLRLSNPSTIAQQQKLELYRSRFEIAQSAMTTEGMVSRDWVRKNVFKMTDDDIEAITVGRVVDREQDLEIEAVRLPGGAAAADELDLGGPPPGEGPPGLETAGDSRNNDQLPLLADETDISSLSISDTNAPIKAQNTVNSLSSILRESDEDDNEEDEEKDDLITPAEKEEWNRKRRKKGSKEARFVDHLSMVSHDRHNVSDSITHPDGLANAKYQRNSDAKNPLKDAYKMPKLTEFGNDFEISDYLDDKIEIQAKMTSRLQSSLHSMDRRLNIKRKVLLENEETNEEGDLS